MYYEHELQADSNKQCYAVGTLNLPSVGNNLIIIICLVLKVCSIVSVSLLSTSLSKD